MASTRKRKKLPKSVYKRRQRNLILAMIGILLVLILSLVLVIRRHGEDTPRMLPALRRLPKPLLSRSAILFRSQPPQARRTPILQRGRSICVTARLP